MVALMVGSLAKGGEVRPIGQEEEAGCRWENNGRPPLKLLIFGGGAEICQK